MAMSGLERTLEFAWQDLANRLIDKPVEPHEIDADVEMTVRWKTDADDEDEES